MTAPTATDAALASTPNASDAPGATNDRPRPGPGDVALEWWHALVHPKHGDPGTLARLRRCRAPVDAATIPAAVRLARRLGALRPERRPTDPRVDAVFDLARVLAHVREHTEERPMRAAGWESFPSNKRGAESGQKPPRLAEARFRRLLQTGEGERQAIAFIRLVELLGAKINVRTLASDFLDWSHPERGPEVRRRWAFDYYAASRATPPDRFSNFDTVSTDDEDDA